MANYYTISVDKTEVSVGEVIKITISSPIDDVFIIDTIKNGVGTRIFSNISVSANSSITLDYVFNDTGNYQINSRNNSTQLNRFANVTVTPRAYNYVLSASQNNYDVVDGEVSIPITLTESDEPVSGETITLTDSESNSYTATTDNNGVATFNLTGIVESDVYTASYSGADSINISVNVYDALILDVSFTGNDKTFSIINNGILYDNVYVDWGDGTSTTNPSSTFEHTYNSVGDYTIRIIGDISVADECFKNNVNIVSVEVPSHINSLSDECFSGCTGLTSIELPDDLDNISSYCFYNCTSLTSISLMDNVESIEEDAFRGCTSLTSIDLPDSITSIGTDAFKDTSLTSIIFNSTVPPTVTGGLGLPLGCVIYIPRDTLNDYTNASNYPSSLTYSYVEMADWILSFDKDIYYTCNGNCTVKALLLDDVEPVGNRLITLTGLTNDLTATTDSNGLATFNLTGINESIDICIEFGLEEDNSRIVYYRNNTLNGSLVCLGRRFVDRLESMGIEEISFQDGLTTLANEILNITPSVGGIDLTTSIDCNAEDTVFLNAPFNITGLLEADYNDETPTDVDLEGYLTGAIVKIYNGETLLGNTVTGNDGTYSFTYTPTSVGNLSLKAVFEGTEYYDACRSNVKSVTVEELTILELSISSDKTILSRNDNENAVITASLTSNNVGVGGKTINYEILDSSNNIISNGSDVTDNNGEIHINYTSTGIGDITVTVGYNELSESLIIEDCIYAEIPQIDTSRNGTTYHLLNGDVIGNLPVTYKIEFDMKTSTQPTNGNEQRIYWSPTDLWSGNGQPSNAMFVGFKHANTMEGGKRNNGSTSSSNRSCSINTWYNIRIEKINNNSAFYIYVDNSYFTWWTVDNAKQFSTWEFGFALWSDTTYSVKNIKIKPL